MKKIYLAALALLSLAANAQTVTDSINMQPRNVNDVYYNFTTQTKDTVNNTNWHLAFALRRAQPPLRTMQAATVRINDGLGVEAYRSDFEGSEWADFDTSGYRTWTQYYNSDSTWDIGALNVERNLSNPFDYGWGEYNMTTRDVNGKVIWLLVLSTNPNNPFAPKIFKKLWIDKISYDTAWMFTIANLDGTDSNSVVISKAAFRNKLFAYYNFTTNQVLDREPDRPWDVLFTRYKALVTLYGQTLMYPVVGALHAPGLFAAKIEGPNAKDVTPNDTGLNFMPNIATINWDWKMITTTPGEWPVRDSLAYMIRKNGALPDGFIYHRLVFTRYYASNSYQNITFNTTTFTSTSVGSTLNNQLAVNVYPNPSKNFIQVASNIPVNAQITITDLSGKMLVNHNHNFGINNEATIDIANLHNGIYLVNISSGEKSTTKRLIISN